MQWLSVSIKCSTGIDDTLNFTFPSYFNIKYNKSDSGQDIYIWS